MIIDNLKQGHRTQAEANAAALAMDDFDDHLDDDGDAEDGEDFFFGDMS